MDTIKNPKYCMGRLSCRVKEEPTQTTHGVAGCVAKPKQTRRMPAPGKRGERNCSVLDHYNNSTNNRIVTACFSNKNFSIGRVLV